MAENVGDDESEFDSITSSQKSFLNNCPFAEPLQPPTTKSPGGGTVDTDSYGTEVLENPISTPVVQTPVISFSSPTSLDSINDEDVFRTPPENTSLSSAADSEPIVKVSEMKPPSKSKSKSLSPVSTSPSFSTGIVRVLETNRLSDFVEPPSSVAAEEVRVPILSSPPPIVAGDFGVPNLSSPLSAISGDVGVPIPSSPPFIAAVDVGVSILSSPPSVATGEVRVPGKHTDLDSSSCSPRPTTKITETENRGAEETPIPFKEIIEALLRNNGENLNERDESFRYVEALKRCGFKFP